MKHLKLFENFKLNEAVSAHDLLGELSSFPSAGVTPELLDKAKTGANAKINAGSNREFKALLKGWESGQYDEDPDALVREISYLLESKLNEGTDAVVAMKTKDGKIIATKVQSDGYPHHMIPNLNMITNYLDVEDMIKGGEMSIINNGEPEYYTKKNPRASFKINITEEDDEAYSIRRVDNELNASYFYYWTAENGWMVQHVGNVSAELQRFISSEDAEKRKFNLPTGLR